MPGARVSGWKLEMNDYEDMIILQYLIFYFPPCPVFSVGQVKYEGVRISLL